MAFDFRSVMSGQRRDPIAILLRGGLWLASGLYRLAVGYRNRQFDSGARESIACPVPVISIGNLTTGGTGKTPLVCFLAGRLRKRNLRVAIVSRGYGRDQQGHNDEAMELYARLPDVPHVQDPDRVAAAEVAVDELESEVILMDDGFQHRRLKRQLDIVVIDATCPFGYGHLLPRGLLREPVTGLKRAQLVIVSRCGSVDQQKLVEIESVVKRHNESLPIVRVDHQMTDLLEHPHTRMPVDSIRGQRVAILSAIGNPIAFEQSMQRLDIEIVDALRLPDHDPYARETVEQIKTWIRSLPPPIDRILCTHKDLVKLQTDRLAGISLVAILIETKLVGDASALDRAIDRVVESIPRDGAA